MKSCERETCDGCAIHFCAYCRHWHVNDVQVCQSATGKLVTLASGVCLAPIRGRDTDFETAADETGCTAFDFDRDRVQTKFGCRQSEGGGV